MNTFQCSPQQLRNAATNADTIGGAIRSHPVLHLSVGDVGHAGVAAALNTFRAAWSGELQLRGTATTGSAALLRGAAVDTEQVDRLLAQAAAQLVART